MTDLPIDEYGQPFKRKLVELVPCQHALNGTFCDVSCKAYVRGDGYYEVTITEPRLSRAEWEATIDQQVRQLVFDIIMHERNMSESDMDDQAEATKEVDEWMALFDAAVKGET